MGKQQRLLQQASNRRKHDFLLTFFTPTNCNEQGYGEIEINGYWLVKQWNGETKEWQVAIYTPESFKKRQDYLSEVPALKLSNGEQTTIE